MVQHAEKDKEVKWSCRNDKRQYFETLASKAEEAAKDNDVSYGNNHDIAVKAKDGKTIKGERERTDRWKEY